MSTPKVPSASDQAEEQRRLEAERAARVRENSATVNRIFDEKYGPSYYKGIGEAFRAYYKPQVETQYRDATRATKLRTADNAGSSAANRQMGDLYRERLRADSDVESGAFDSMNQAKQDVEGKRANVINMVEAGGSLEGAAGQARAAAQSNLGARPFQPIGDLFAKYARSLDTAARVSDNGGQVPGFYQKQIDFLRGGSGGSQRIVGGR